jgi:hypothetical protein
MSRWSEFVRNLRKLSANVVQYDATTDANETEKHKMMLRVIAYKSELELFVKGLERNGISATMFRIDFEQFASGKNFSQ